MVVQCCRTAGVGLVRSKTGGMKRMNALVNCFQVQRVGRVSQPQYTHNPTIPHISRCLTQNLQSPPWRSIFQQQLLNQSRSPQPKPQRQTSKTSSTTTLTATNSPPAYLKHPNHPFKPPAMVPQIQRQCAPSTNASFPFATFSNG